jgi:predicted Zn-dependent peptidase
MKRSAALLVLIITVSTATKAERVPAPEQLPSGFQNLERKELSNGLKVLIGKPLRPALFSEVLLVVRAGTGTAGPSQEEIARIAGQTLLSGRRSQESPSVRVELARLGVLPDFIVGREVAVFRFAVPTVNTHSFLHLLADLLNRRRPPNRVWEDAMAQRARELARERSDPWQRATAELTSLLWANRPDNRLPHLLSRPIESETLSAKALNAFWEQRYTPGNMVLSIWGNFPIDDVGNEVEQEFGALAAGNLKDAAVSAPEPVRTGGGSVACLRDDGAMPPALLVGVGVDVNSDRAFYAWQIAAHILGASSNSRLQHKLRTESQAVYTIEAAGVPVGLGGMIVRIACQTDQVDMTRNVILQELRRIVQEPVSQQELDLARALLRSRLKLDSASFRDRLYRRSLELLSLEGVRDPAQAENVLSSFTPATLLDVLSSSLKPEEASTVIVSAWREPLCRTRQNSASGSQR